MAAKRNAAELVVKADGSGAVKAFAEIGTAWERLRSKAEGVLDPFTRSVASATKGAGELKTQLKPLEAVIGGLSATLLAKKIIDMADGYGQMTARLRLATQYTGDFEQVQQLLRQAAEQTRGPLTETVNLYSRLAPSLAAVGRTGRSAVGIVTTVNQAIALSGASAAESSASLVQFGQGLASGVLRGDELNSILEQTPSLADAIAEGLGVTRGELRSLGEQGRLTTEEVVKALEKVRERVEADFNSLPLTIGQALTLLNNRLLEIVGTADQGSGALAALARAIVFVAEGIERFASAGDTVAPVVDFVVNAVDGVSRLFRITATGLAGYTLAIKQALGGDLQGALDTYRNISDEVHRILQEPLAQQQRLQGQYQATGNARLKVETDLADEIAKLEKMRAVAAGKANADILKDEQTLQAERIKAARTATQEQLKGAEKLRDTLRDAWQKSIEGARKANEEAQKFLKKGDEAQQEGIDRANEIMRRGMTESERETSITREARDLRDSASSSANRAMLKVFEGDLAAAETLAESAMAHAARAQRLADQLPDDRTTANLQEELGNIRKAANEALARMKEREAAAKVDEAAGIQKQIAAADQRLLDLKEELKKPIELELDITKAEKRIEQLRNQLKALEGNQGTAPGEAAPDAPATAVAVDATRAKADLGAVKKAVEEVPKEKTVKVKIVSDGKTSSDQASAWNGAQNGTISTKVVAETTEAENQLQGVKAAVEAIPAEKTVTIRTVSETGTVGFSDAASAWNSAQNSFATGGAVSGPGTGTSDSILARLSDGEFVVRAAAVRRYGANFLQALNSMALPRFATGGMVGGGSRIVEAMASGGAGGTSSLRPFNITIPGVGQTTLYSPRDMEGQVAALFYRAALQRGRRRN